MAVASMSGSGKAFILSQSIPFGIDIHMSLIIQDALGVYIAFCKPHMWKYAVSIIIKACLEHAGFDSFYCEDPLKIYDTIFYYIPVLLIFTVSSSIFYFACG
ncbi:hypothetical protein AA12717_1340 [Gluconacetobacter sacchari DSM 12717]|uniref:Uncharacterized protein n=1 Tax=Gluconacetobacter sacchari DSM 12717 TaxID=1307940 RepID=A0ABQ0P5H2_9PROT|nr:hypothetical protein AA12717_1340 [Gluconacetobacter sacchari DSM 12717]